MAAPWESALKKYLRLILIAFFIYSCYSPLQMLKKHTIGENLTKMGNCVASKAGDRWQHGHPSSQRKEKAVPWIQYFNLACVLVFAGLLVWASIGDVRVYRIPNWISLAIAALYIPFVLSSGDKVGPMLLQGYTVGLLALAIGFLLFMTKIMGGGDAKLLSAIGIWAGTAHAWDALVLTAVAGGILAVIVAATIPMRIKLRGKAMVDKVRATKLPYGVAIAVGGLYVAWQHGAAMVTKLGM
jgi:prepilin peptidase CpaA